MPGMPERSMHESGDITLTIYPRCHKWDTLIAHLTRWMNKDVQILHHDWNSRAEAQIVRFDAGSYLWCRVVIGRYVSRRTATWKQHWAAIAGPYTTPPRL
jgi:hypothetical protein